MGILSILFFALSALSLFGALFFMVPFYITITFLLAGIVSYWMKSILEELKQINKTLLKTIAKQPKTSNEVKQETVNTDVDYEGIPRRKGEGNNDYWKRVFEINKKKDQQ